jgi:hypothetical protein
MFRYRPRITNHWIIHIIIIVISIIITSIISIPMTTPTLIKHTTSIIPQLLINTININPLNINILSLSHDHLFHNLRQKLMRKVQLQQAHILENKCNFSWWASDELWYINLMQYWVVVIVFVVLDARLELLWVEESSEWTREG